MNTEPKPTDELSDELKLLKKKHGFLKQVHIKKLNKTLIFKKPDRNIVSLVVKVKDDDIIEANRLLAINCLVHGDASVIEDIDVQLSLTGHLEDLIEDYEMEVKNL